MRIHFFQHVPFEGLGSIQPWIEKSGHILQKTQLFKSHNLPKVNDFDALIIMGGSMGIYDHEIYSWLPAEKNLIAEAIQSGKKILGICLGAQLIADVLGAKISNNEYREIGWYPVEKTAETEQSAINTILPDNIEVFHWHGDTFEIPDDSIRLFRSTACENQAFIYKEQVLALQFHLEMMYQNCEEIIKNGSDDLISGPSVQTAEEMLAKQDRFDKTNILMNTILDYFLK